MKPFRKFLTTPDLADSYIRVESSYGSATLKLADCNRTVELTFSYDKPKHLNKSLRKLAVLEEGITRLREELESKKETK